MPETILRLPVCEMLKQVQHDGYIIFKVNFLHLASCILVSRFYLSNFGA